MAFQPNDDLKRAKEALTIFRLWELAGLPGMPPTKDGMYHSPFREEKTPSFSITKHGKVWADFGGDGRAKGGVWEFAARCPCWANLDDAGMAKLLIEASGILPTPRPQSASSPATPAAPGSAPAAEVDPRLIRAAKTLARRDRERATENAIYAEIEQQLAQPERKPAVTWPDCVRDRYAEGMAALRERTHYIEEFARDRGWPAAWAWGLLKQQLISLAWERGATPGERWAKRQKAFAVLAPRLAMDGKLSLESIGYHQRFYIPERDGTPARKGWLYLPSLPKDKHTGGLAEPRSDYEGAIIAAARARGVVVDDVPSLVPPVPFVMGELQAPRLIVLLEGQWDAITFYGACGWFMDDDQVDALPMHGCTVFGIRGAQGLDAFLGHWWPWLERHQPRVWVIADNDAAGGAWRDAPAAEPGLPRPPSLGERLEAAGCRRPLISWLKRGPWGKDFNDYFKARAAGGKPLTADKMRVWMAKQGLLDASGGWA